MVKIIKNSSSQVPAHLTTHLFQTSSKTRRRALQSLQADPGPPRREFPSPQWVPVRQVIEKKTPNLHKKVIKHLENRRITRLDQLLSDTHYDLKLPQEEKDMIWAGMEWGFENAYRLHVDMWRNRKNIRSRYSEFPGTITSHICPLDDHNFALDHFLTDNFIHDDWYDVVEHYYVLQQAAYISSIYISCTLSSRSPHSRFYL